MSGHRFTRAAIRRLRTALTSGNPEGILEAGALASAAIDREPDVAAAGRRAAAMLEALLLDAAEVLPAPVRGRLEHAVEECLCGGVPGPVPGALDRLWRDLATAVRIPTDQERGSLAAAVQEYLAASLGGRATLGELARRLGYSPAHASTLVRRVTGKPFRVVRREMQLAHARWLLERGASVKQAALESGFSDPAYLSRVFARAQGVPPSRWRVSTSTGPAPPSPDASQEPAPGSRSRRGRPGR